MSKSVGGIIIRPGSSFMEDFRLLGFISSWIEQVAAFQSTLLMEPLSSTCPTQDGGWSQWPEFTGGNKSEDWTKNSSPRSGSEMEQYLRPDVVHYTAAWERRSRTQGGCSNLILSVSTNLMTRAESWNVNQLINWSSSVSKHVGIPSFSEQKSTLYLSGDSCPLLVRSGKHEALTCLAWHKWLFNMSTLSLLHQPKYL